MNTWATSEAVKLLRAGVAGTDAQLIQAGALISAVAAFLPVNPDEHPALMPSDDCEANAARLGLAVQLQHARALVDVLLRAVLMELDTESLRDVRKALTLLEGGFR